VRTILVERKIRSGSANGPLIVISGPFPSAGSPAAHLLSYRGPVVRPTDQASAVAYFASPSAFSASCTFGRPLTRAI
jgi:hypothetical protein